jgi:hypothetical protein
VTDEGIEGLSSLSQLRSLSYGYTSMPEADAVAAAIARQFTALTGAVFRDLAPLQQALLCICRRLPAGAVHLYTLTNQQYPAACCLLTALDLLASELTDSGLSSLSKLPQLQELKLYQAGVTAEGILMLAGQPAGIALHSLVLYGTGALRELSCLGEQDKPCVWLAGVQCCSLEFTLSGLGFMHNVGC